MGRLLVMSLACVLHATSWARAPVDVVILCDAGYPPYSYAEEGEAKGIYADILRVAFARMPDYRVRIRPLPWTRALAELAKGRAFALYPPYKRTSERPWMDYSRPILREKLVVFVRADVARKLSDKPFPQAYVGLRIGQNSGFINILDQDYQRMLGRGELHQVRVKDNRTSLAMLYRGRLDAYINDRRAVLWELERMHSNGVLGEMGLTWIVEGPWLSGEEGHLGYSRSRPRAYPYKEDFKKHLDAILADLEREGVIYRIVTRYDASYPLQLKAVGI
ncbi:transporter substrate-binding domain-containing protein [Pseudomonas benzenivorans]|uniref:Transporter substrate-binding domain-containing protein n=1 Tax=Pseudomonas benzenivorans TaxID=556533 RepID=A0ABZ0Q0F1_9PSED|nr:transporter substrate-binding domain-containing protein [Pseudomonas benzenivorans]WPC06174.1 transporter substrate-binding domain-containing protein [Pseudomonas benzenivorans]